MSTVYLVTQPANDDGGMDDHAEIVVAADHASRIWAGRVNEADLLEQLPGWLSDQPRDPDRYVRLGGK